jgi:hypothetical protein
MITEPDRSGVRHCIWTTAFGGHGQVPLWCASKMVINIRHKGGDLRKASWPNAMPYEALSDLARAVVYYTDLSIYAAMSSSALEIRRMKNGEN